MLLIQYTIQFLGATLIVIGFLSAQAVRKSGHKGSYWTKIDTAKANRELPEFMMDVSARGARLLVLFSSAFCAGGLSLGLAFPDLLYSNLDPSSNLQDIRNGIYGAQILNFLTLICVFLISFFLIQHKEDKLDEDKRFDLKFIIPTSLFILASISAIYVVVRFSVDGMLDVHQIIDPIFSEKIDNYFYDIVVNFATSTVLLSYPSLLVALIVWVSLSVLNEVSSLSIDEEIISKISQIIFIFIVGFVGSTFYTLNSGALGNALQDASTQPVTFQLVMANAVFDGATLFATVSLLYWASASWRSRIALSRVDSTIRENASDSGYAVDLRSRIRSLADEIERGITELKKVKSNEDFESYLKQSWSLFKTGFRESNSGLQELSRIFQGGDLITFDRALYRLTVQSDQDVTLVGSRQKPVNARRFQSGSSWVLYTLETFQNDLKDALNELGRAESAESNTIVADKDNSRPWYISAQNLEPEQMLSVMPRPQLDQHFKATWDVIDRERQQFRYRPVIAIAVDIILATLFAYGSIFFGLVGRVENLDLSRLNTYFFGGQTLGEFTELGPIFWIMHTTFIPSILLIFLLSLLCLSAFIVSPFIDWVGKKTGFAIYDSTSDDYKVIVNFSLAKTGTLIGALGTLLMIFNQISGYINAQI